MNTTTKAERHEIYKEALTLFQSDRIYLNKKLTGAGIALSPSYVQYCLCWTFVYLLQDKTPDSFQRYAYTNKIINALPEFGIIKPQTISEHYEGYWFIPGEDGKQQRIELIEKLIEMTKP